jgi:hypothetical protein
MVGLCHSTFAINYYVDKASSGGDGTTQATSGVHAAFKTIAAVNGASFSAGDSILFKRACTWREQLTVPSAGSARDQITFGVYGSGAKPQINGADLVTSWTDNGASVVNTWMATVTRKPKMVIFNGTRGTSVASVAACDGDKKWYWAANVLYTYGAVNPNTTYPTQIESSARNFAVQMNIGYLTLQNLDLRNVNSMGWQSKDSNYITVDGLDIT